MKDLYELLAREIPTREPEGLPIPDEIRKAEKCLYLYNMEELVWSTDKEINVFLMLSGTKFKFESTITPNHTFCVKLTNLTDETIYVDRVEFQAKDSEERIIYAYKQPHWMTFEPNKTLEINWRVTEKFL